MRLQVETGGVRSNSGQITFGQITTEEPGTAKYPLL